MVSQSALLLVLLAVATCSRVVQGITNEGNEFILMVPPVKSPAQAQLMPQLLVTTSEDMNISFTVSYNAPSRRLSASSQTFTASKGSVTKVNLPTQLRASTTSPNNLDIAVNVKAEGNKTIVVYLLNEDAASTDIALLYPKFATKTNTYVYYAVSSPSTTENPEGGERSFVGIVATEDNCVVEITPTATANAFVSRGRPLVHNQGVLVTSLPLPKQTVIFMSSQDDLTGTKVTGTCYLSVITGHQCAFYPANVQSCDGILEQIPPTETWGFNFFLSPLAKRQSAGYRFIAGADNTVVTRRCNGAEPDTFNLTLAGNYREVLVNMPTYCHVESNQPLLVAQYSLGHEYGGINDIFADPFVTLIAPVGQFNNKYNFILVQSVTPQDIQQAVVFDPYLNLLVTNDCCERNDILYDGQPLPSSVSFTDIACTGGEVCGCAAQFHPSVNTGTHTLMHSRDSCSIGATLYAWQNQNSYGSMAGTRLDSIGATMYCLKESSLTVTEGAGVVEFTATRTGTVGQADCINVTVVDISTQGSNDVEPPSECCFAAGEREATCDVTIVRDSISESDEMFNIRLNPRSGQCVCNPPDGPNLKVTIVEGGVQAITVNFDPVVYNVSEDSGSAIVLLKASSPALSEYIVTVTTQDGTAIAGQDYTGGSYTATFLVGQTTASVSIPITDDTTAELTEDFSAVLTIPATAASQGITKGAADTATINITDDDPVEVVFNPTQYSVNEGDGVVTLILNADNPCPLEYTVEVLTQDGTATAPSDYQPGPYSVTFPAGSTTAAVNITIESDSVFEGTETFTATISTANTGFPKVTAGDDDTATINIQEDASIQVTFNPTDYSVSEDAGNVVLTLLANQPASFDYTVQVDTVDGSAVAGQDYTGGSYPAIFLAGETTASVSIPITDDTTAESTEDFSGVLNIPPTAASQGVTKGAADTATIDITDDDTVEVVFNPTQYSINEGDGVVILTLKADKAASCNYTVQVLTQDGTATATSDYTPGPYSVTFPAGSTTAAVNIPILSDNVLEGTENFTATISTANIGCPKVTAGDDDTATINIQEDASIQVTFNQTQYSVSEDAGNVVLTLLANQPASFDYTVQVDTVDGSAVAGQDYTGGSYTVTFLAGQTTASVSIPITNDTTAELTEDFSAVLTIPATAASQNITKGAAATATLDIVDDDTVEVVFNPTQYTVNEGDGVVTLTLNADKNASFDYTVQVLTQDGTATASSDYQPGPYSVTFPAGSTTAAVNITIESDSVLEGTETFTATISTANTGFPSVTAGDDDTATINIQEDASIQVNFNPTQYSVSEDAGNVVLVLLANQPASFDYTVQVDTVDGSAVGGLDFQSAGYLATFPAGNTTVFVPCPIINDTIAELTETFFAVLTIPAAAASQGIAKGAADTATINITDDDTVEVVFNPIQYTVNEGDGVVTLTLNADKPASFEYTVEVETQDGTANASSDYQPCNCSVTFPAGSTIAAVNITIYNDAVYEGPDPEAFTATISTANTGVSSISPGDDDTATISINENEALSVEFDPTEYAISEADGSAQLVVKASVPASFDYDVVITTSDLSATANDDYSGGPFSVTIPAGQTQVSQQVPILQDVEAEGSEQFQAQLTIPSASADLGVTVGDDDTAVITILDDDGVLVEFSPAQYPVSEGDGVVTLTLTADSVADCNYTVEVRTRDGTATAPSDYLSLPYNATFLAGSTSATVDIILVEDDIYEANIGAETFTVSISAISAVGCSVSPGPNRTATVSITDNDDLTVQFNPATYDVFESNGSVTLLLETDKQFQYPFTVNVGTADGTAVAPEDYVDGTYNVTFIPELTTAELQVPIVDDTVCEDEEVFFGNIIIPTALVANGVRAGPQNTATITIHDDDVAAVQFDPVQYRVREHDGNAVLQLVSNNTCQFDYNVTVDVSNGTATVGSDFGSGPFTASFPAGSTTSSVNVPITDDQLQEGDETFAAQLQIPSNVPDTVVQGQNTVAQVVIEDNEEVITVNFNPARYEVSEDGLNVELTLVASRPSPVPYSITVNTIDGTAQAFSDYVGGPYVVDFPANETTVRLQIAIMDDTERCECSEDFTASLEVPAAAGQLGVVPGVNDTAEIIIIDDDLCPISFNPEQYSVAENVQGGTVEVCLTVEENCYGDFSVMLQTGNKSAQGPPDYEPGPFTVNFPPNVDRACTNIPIVDDEIFEGDQYFCVSIVVPPDLSLTPGRKANITIVDDDTDVFCSVQQDSITVNEADGIIAVDISISRPVEKPFICEIESQPASAKEGEDFQPIIRNITFLPQESTTREVQLEIVNDDREEGNENLIIFVKDVRGQQVSPVPINVTIIDDEAQGTGDPMFTVPLSLSEETVEKFGQMSICYEVHGKPNKTFNLLSDICVSVNAFYSPAKDQKIGNIMSKIGVLTEDSDGVCQRIEVDLDGCASSVNGQKVSEYYQSGVRVIQRRGKRVRIATPNCGDSDVVMWVICEVQMKERMIKFVISRGDSLRPASHGLIGQFWKTEVSAERYHVKPEDKIQPDQNQFAVTLKKASGEQRRFFAHLYGRTWDRKQKPCLYAGSSQGGRTMEVPSLSGTVIEGRYTHYIVDELMDPKFKYSQFKSQCPTKAWAH